MTQQLKDFLDKYKNIENLVDKLMTMYDFIDEIFTSEIALHEKFGILNEMIKHFDKHENHLSELKTMLLVSAPFKDHVLIFAARNSLIHTYKKKHLELNSMRQ